MIKRDLCAPWEKLSKIACKGCSLKNLPSVLAKDERLGNCQIINVHDVGESRKFDGEERSKTK